MGCIDPKIDLTQDKHVQPPEIHLFVGLQEFKEKARQGGKKQECPDSTKCHLKGKHRVEFLYSVFKNESISNTNTDYRE